MALVVVAEEATRIKVSASLLKVGFEVERAWSGDHALSAFRRLRPDIVLLDPLLPGMDGFTVLETLRTLPGGDRVPVLAIIAAEDIESILLAYDSGATDIITKPIDWTILGHRTRYVLRASRALVEINEAESRYRDLFDGVPVGLFRSTPGGKLLDANPVLARLWGGGGREELLATSCKEFYANPQDRDRFLARMEKDGFVRNFEVQIRRANGGIRWAEFNATAVRGPDGRTVVFEGSLQDIDERKRAEKSLLETYQTLAALIQASPLAICISDLQGCVKMWNPAAEILSGWKEEEVIGRLNPSIPPGRKEEAMARREHLLKGNKITGLEFTLQKKDGFPVDVLISSAPLYDAEKKIMAVMSIVADITEQKRSKAELDRSRGQLRDLTVYIQSAIEEERKRIAREIHDELGKGVMGLKLDLSWMRKRMAGERGGVAQRVDTALRDIDEIIRTVQRISTDVRPAMLDDLGIGAAIEWQAGEFTRRTGIPCKVSLDPEEIVLDKNRSTALFRIFQESLTNISRHAGATSITVGLVMREGRMHLEIEDNGRGITGKEISAPRSFGLIGMRERVLPLGGEVEIRGVPGRGTTITVRLPLLEGEEVFQ